MQTTLLTGGWLSLPEAVARLGKSHSTLERLVGSRQVNSHLEKRKGRKPERLYKAEDIDRHAAREGEATSRSLTAPKKPPQQQAVTVPALDALLAKLAELERERRQAELEERKRLEAKAPTVPIAEKMMLTLAEAEAYSGYGERYLMSLIGAGKVKAVKGGPHGCWIIQRKSLEECEPGGEGSKEKPAALQLERGVAAGTAR